MNIILLTAFIFTVALTHVDNMPCSERSRSYKYHNFVRRHILRENFDRNSTRAWRRYLRNNGLWCRTEIQSFMERKYRHEVKQICSRAGRRLAKGQDEAGNLCMSRRRIWQYEVKCHSGRVIRVARRKKPVIVGCDVVNNVCRPVHFERYRHQSISNNRCML